MAAAFDDISESPIIMWKAEIRKPKRLNCSFPRKQTTSSQDFEAEKKSAPEHSAKCNLYCTYTCNEVWPKVYCAYLWHREYINHIIYSYSIYIYSIFFIILSYALSIVLFFPPPVRWGLLDFYVSCTPPSPPPPLEVLDRSVPRRTSTTEDIPDRTPERLSEDMPDTYARKNVRIYARRYFRIDAM